VVGRLAAVVLERTASSAVVKNLLIEISNKSVTNLESLEGGTMRWQIPIDPADAVLTIAMLVSVVAISLALFGSN
jgi:hypothetical protein